MMIHFSEFYWVAVGDIKIYIINDNYKELLEEKIRITYTKDEEYWIDEPDV